MIRVQISLSEDDYAAAKGQARRLEISLAELLRRALRLVLRVDGGKPWMRFAGFIASGDLEPSLKIDEAIYSRKD